MRKPRRPTPQQATELEPIFQDMTGSQRLDIKFLIFIQINRCNTLMIKAPELLYQAVLGLEIILLPYQNDKYRKKIAPIKKRLGRVYKEAEDSEQNGNSYPDAWVEKHEFNAAIRLYRALITLADDEKFYPEKEIESWDEAP